MPLEIVDDHAAILRASTPLLDVRAAVEFARGAVPGAVNLPLLTDAERAEVGRTYKNRGREAAIAIGERLVEGEAKECRLAAWRSFAHAHPNGLVCCARGGLRSAIVQRWLAADGIHLPCVAGGFKALRRSCLETIERAAAFRFVVVGGRTGVGKTRIVRTVPNHLDLEGLAHHRGSAFGGWPTPQPVPVSFENALAVALLQQQKAPFLAVEDEGRSLGRLAIPEALFKAMQRSPIAIVEAGLERRIDNIHREYVADAEDPAPHLFAGLQRIRRRLGDVAFRSINALMAAAFAGDGVDAHRAWIRRLLEDYYDPMYDYQLRGKQQRVAMRGDAVEVAAYLDGLSRPMKDA